MHQESALPASVKAHDPPGQNGRSPGAGNAGAHQRFRTQEFTTLARRGQAAAQRPTLSRDDRENLRRLTALANRVVDLLVDAAGLTETRWAAYALADELASWHRRVDPTLHGGKAGGRP